MSETRQPSLVLNLAPISFSRETIEIGKVAWEDEDSYRQLRDENWRTHAFRFDQRYNTILNIALKSHVQAFGQTEEVRTGEHLLLLAQAVNQMILAWVGNRIPVLKKNSKRLLFLGQSNDALLLTKACQQVGVEQTPGLEIALRYEIDCRLFYDREDTPYLGLLLDVGTTNIIDLSVKELLELGFPISGRYVGRHREDGPAYLRPGLRLMGRVAAVEGDSLLLVDSAGDEDITTDAAYLEPRQENIDAIIETLYGRKSVEIIQAVSNLRQEVVSSTGRLRLAKQTLDQLRQRRLNIAGEIEVQLGDLLDDLASRFPDLITTQRPGFLFGAQGRNSAGQPDAGIRNFGPYMFMQHTRNTPTVGVVCEARHRGTVEQFLQLLRNGVPEESWRGQGDNPFRGGLIGKFRLGRINFEFETVGGTSAGDYRAAARRLLNRLHDAPDLSFVQIRREFVQLSANDNPYFAAKAAFMAADVPVQAVFLDNMRQNAPQLPYILNNVALACYAKLEGTPWVISTKGTTTHELILGIGSAEVSEGRLGDRERYVGITTVFQGDGRYLISNQTREVTFEDYPAALLDTLRATIRHVQLQNGWEAGDRVRLICHVFKRLRDAEVDTIKLLVRELIDDRFSVEFAFLDISSSHSYRLFAPKQPGVWYFDRDERAKRLRGTGIPERGVCLQLDRRRVLLHLVGPNDVKLGKQGLPQPLLLELHQHSDFTDMAYLARQAYHFIYASWKTFTPATEPVTILYSRLIANLLGNLRQVQGWNSTALTVGGLRGRCWFL